MEEVLKLTRIAVWAERERESKSLRHIEELSKRYGAVEPKCEETSGCGSEG